MADRSQHLIFDALRRAAAEAGGIPLFGSRVHPGVFASTAAGRQAASHCLAAGYLRLLRKETRGKVVQDICSITPEGISYLLAETSPREVLEALKDAALAQERRVDELLAAARRCQETMAAIRELAEKTLREKAQDLGSRAGTPSPNGTEAAAVVQVLAAWQEAHAGMDCPLPELRHLLAERGSKMSIGSYHDLLRRLHAAGEIHLHPWTGPLHELPEPELALLVGHSVAYYASRKGS